MKTELAAAVEAGVAFSILRGCLRFATAEGKGLEV